MKYSHIPGTDIKISKLAIGGMSFGIPAVKTYRWILDEDQTDKMVQYALNLGINFFDTANVYGAGTSEEFIGRSLKKYQVPRDQGHRCCNNVRYATCRFMGLLRSGNCGRTLRKQKTNC